MKSVSDNFTIPACGRVRASVSMRESGHGQGCRDNGLHNGSKIHETPVCASRPAIHTDPTPSRLVHKLLHTLRVTQAPRPVSRLGRIVTEHVPVQRKRVPRVQLSAIVQIGKPFEQICSTYFYLSDPLLNLEIFTPEYGGIKKYKYHASTRFLAYLYMSPSWPSIHKPIPSPASSFVTVLSVDVEGRFLGAQPSLYIPHCISFLLPVYTPILFHSDGAHTNFTCPTSPPMSCH